MKKVLFCFLTLISISSFSQDGLARWIDTDSVDTFISVYNSPFDKRVEVAEFFLDEINNNNHVLKANSFKIILGEDIVSGEIFITLSESYILYDVYIDIVTYKDGTSYSSERFVKPKGPIDYTKF